MSDSGRNNFGRPDAMVEAGYLRFIYCGGSGGGGCVSPMGVTSKVLEYRLQKYIVFNKRIVFENREFFGVRMYTDAGPDGLGCTHSLGSEVPFWLALSIDGNLTDAEVIARGKQVSGALPYQIEFNAKDIPQPYEGGWASHVFLHVVWGNTGYINGGNVLGTITPDAFRIVKHDYDVRL